MRMYVNGKKLAGIKVITGATEIIFEILEFSSKVDEKVFELPKGYTEISY